MIEYVTGRFTEKTPTYIIVEAAGLGYHVNVSLSTYSDVNEQDEGRLLVHYAVSVDVRSGESRHQLFGFSTPFEREMFRTLVSVSGVSATLAMMILSSFKARELQTIILTGDAKTLTSVKGIGPKVAQKVVTELKGKVANDDQVPDLTEGGGNTLRQEALSALTALGFDRGSTVKVINNLLKQEEAPATVESLIKQALKQL